MAEFTSKVLTDNTKFIRHTSGDDLLIIEVKDGHILSISVSSKKKIELYRGALVKRDEREQRDQQGTVYGDTGMDAGDLNLRHRAVHDLGITDGAFHDHFASRREKKYDGIHMLALFIPLVTLRDVCTITQLVKSTVP